MTIFHYNLKYWCTVGNTTPTNMKICTNEVKHGEGLVTRQLQNWDADSSPLTLRITEHRSVSNKVMPTFKQDEATVAKWTRPLHPHYIWTYLPCALLASGACTLLLATHHIPNPQKPLIWGLATVHGSKYIGLAMVTICRPLDACDWWQREANLSKSFYKTCIFLKASDQFWKQWEHTQSWCCCLALKRHS
jgi:hypothetical protein